ncbi:MAG: pitrilysin family protein, partial [Smithella sp.]
TTQINYLAGSNEAPNGFPGMAHAQEHMMFRGSPGLSADQLAGIIALTGGEFNADTQQTVTQYYFTVDKDNIDIALNIEALRMKGVNNSPELWKQERGAIEQEVARDLSNPRYLLYNKLLSSLFAGTPYAYDALGTIESFQKTTGTMLKNFYNQWYAPNNAVLVIVGDIDAGKTLARVKQLFEPIPGRTLPEKKPVQLVPVKPLFIKMDSDLPYGLSLVAYQLPGYNSIDYAAGVILADVLDSHRADLFSLVPDGKALFTTFESNILPLSGFGFAAAAFGGEKDGKALVNEIKKIIHNYGKNGIPADLVEAAKRREITNAEFRKNSIMGLASAWSQAVAVEGRNSPDDDIEMIKKVTAQDVNRVAKEYLVNNRAVAAVLTPRPSGRPVNAKSFGGGESFVPTKNVIPVLPLWAKKVETLPALPVIRVKPDFIILSNGIRLVFRSEKVSPTITVMGKIKNNPDLQEPKGKEGVSLVLSNLLSYGTKSRNRLSFEKAVDDIGAQISTGTSFLCKVLPDNFDRGMELIAENMLQPALPEAAFKVIKTETIAALRDQLKSPDYILKRTLQKGLFPINDPALREATPQTVNTVSLSDVKSYYKKTFRPDMTTIVIIGQIDKEKARKVVEKYFGHWKAEGPKPETDLPRVESNKSSVFFVPDANRIQDSVVLAETIGITRSHPDYYTLELGNHVLSGAFYASRLYRDLREKAGLVYTIQSNIEAGKKRSIFSVSYGCNPSNTAKARTMVEQDIRDMQEKEIETNELLRARILLLRKIPLSEASVDGIAEQYLSLSLQDLPLDEPLHAAGRYRAITAEQVREAFRKWLRPSEFVQVTLGSRHK